MDRVTNKYGESPVAFATKTFLDKCLEDPIFFLNNVLFDTKTKGKVMPKVRITKEVLSKENTTLKREVSELSDRDTHLRNQFSEVLNGLRNIHHLSMRSCTLSWEEIFFKVGELNSDANYSILVEEKERLQRTNQELLKEIDRLKNPMRKTTHALDA